MRKQGMSWTDNLNLTRRRGNLNLHLNKIKQILLEILQKTDYYIEVLFPKYFVILSEMKT